MSVREVIEFRSMHQIGVEAAGFNRKRREAGTFMQGFPSKRIGRFGGTQAGQDIAKARAGNSKRLFAKDVQFAFLGEVRAETVSVSGFAPAGNAAHLERGQSGIHFENLGRRTGPVDLHQAAAALPLSHFALPPRPSACESCVQVAGLLLQLRERQKALQQ